MDISGRVVSHYRISNRSAAAAWEVVYLAEDVRLGRRVAVKFLPDEFSRDRTAVVRQAAADPLAGLMSRCTMPFACAASRASAI
jgi:hypothetical protein